MLALKVSISFTLAIMAAGARLKQAKNLEWAACRRFVTRTPPQFRFVYGGFLGVFIRCGSATKRRQAAALQSEI
jgi:hypothetical protein